MGCLNQVKKIGLEAQAWLLLAFINRNLKN